MPQWARFLSCSFTGLLVSLIGFFTAAYLFEGTADYWQSLANWLVTPAFWYLAGLFGLLVALALVAARLLVRIYGLTDGTAGLAAGAVVPLIYALFLAATHAGNWGPGAIWQKTFPAALVFALPFALASGFTAWLWDRLG
ncbi:MAG: hypothetical protein K0R39_4755 [Symbiobacteriaceae bacterium]|nr:hypothetical protein [Symbiobacteriaceae bacterium]